MTLEELLALLEQAENAEALSELSLEEAQALREQLQTGYNDVRPGVTDRDGVEALRRVVAAVGTVDARIAELEQEAQGLEDELAELDAAVNGPEPGTEGEGEGDGGGETTTETTTEGEGEGAASEGDGTTTTEGQGETRVAASGRPSLDALNRTQRRRPAPEHVEDPDLTRLVASSGMPNASPGQRMTVAQLGRELAELHETMQVLTPNDLPFAGEANPRTGEVVRAGGRKLILGHIPIADRPGVVHMRDGDGSEVIDRAVREFVAARDERLRITAAGGDCVMAQPDYSVRLIGDRGTCFTDELPTVAGNRPLAYYPWIQIDQSAGATGRGSRTLADEGIGFVTSEEDAAGYGNPDAGTGDPDEIPAGGVAYKSCVHIDCPPAPLSCSQEAVYKCVTIGNFQAISHPEYVQLFQDYMDVWFDIERDERALQSYVAEATAQSHLLTTDAGDKQFGAVSSLKDILARIVAKERSARHAPNLGFNIVAPDWFGGFLALDIMRHTFGSLDNLRVTAAQAMALASTDGIGAISTYCTETNFAGTPKQVLTPVSSGVVPDWPATARLLMYPDGALFKKTAGDLRFGLRETLMKTNDFGMFQESFEKVCYRGSVFVLDVALCPNGATGAPVALTC